MKKKIKRYKVSPNESLCLAVSVVDKPAVESEFLFFNEQKMEKFVGVEGEKRMIYGCALRPDFPIYRNNGEEEYYLEFDKDSIDKISKNYFKMGFQSNWTAAHKDEVEGLTVTESWIKESMTLDKSVAIGLDPELPIGSWFIGCHCENDEIWNKVKQGNYHGFSIEAVVGVEEFEKQVEEINNNLIDINMSEDTFFDKIKSIFLEAIGKNEEKEVKDEEVSEPVKEEFEEEAKVVENKVEETTTETPKEEVKSEEPIVEEKPAEEPKNEPEEPKEEVKAEEPKQDNHLEELISSLKSEIEALKEMNGGLQEKIKALGKQPSTKPVSTTAKPNPKDTYAQWRDQMRQYLG